MKRNLLKNGFDLPSLGRRMSILLSCCFMATAMSLDASAASKKSGKSGASDKAKKSGSSGKSGSSDKEATENTASNRLIITAAEPNFEDDTMVISGHALGDKNFNGQVALWAPTLGFVDLSVLAYDQAAQELLVSLPEGIESTPGSLLLHVINGKQAKRSDTFSVTIGSTGPQGERGQRGKQGPQGEPGSEGPTGPTGADGVQGPQGEPGPQGSAGATGSQGETGPRGLQGLPGTPGAQGDRGPIGPQGAPGAKGERGPQGIAGLVWLGSWDTSANYQMDDAVGYDGSAWIANASNTSSEPGVSAHWELLASRGEDGSDGSQGPVGPEGPQGDPGPQGERGSDGAQGPVGPEGPQGDPGPQGERGSDGSQGPVGPEGPQGERGPEGPQGPSTTNSNKLYIGSDHDDNESWSILGLGVDGARLVNIFKSKFAGRNVEFDANIRIDGSTVGFRPAAFFEVFNPDGESLLRVGRFGWTTVETLAAKKVIGLSVVQPSATQMPFSIADTNENLILGASVTGEVGVNDISDGNALTVKSRAGDDLALNVKSSLDSDILVVDDDGRVGIGRTGSSAVLRVNGRSEFNNIIAVGDDEGTNHFLLTNEGDLTTRNISHFSDRRLKQDIVAMKPMLSKVLALQPKRYRMRSDEDKREPEIGFIAQDVQKVFPGLVGQSGDYLALRYDAFGVIAVKAIQEQQAQLDEKDAKIEDLSERLERLERLLDAENRVD